MIIGGYGNFGSYISRVLAKEQKAQLLIAGRNPEKAKKFISGLEAVNRPEAIYCDINKSINEIIKNHKPTVVIHTSGPFQGQNYSVVEACIENQSNYIDLADARAYVDGISQFNKEAKTQNILICSGASSVPGLSSAVIDKFMREFSILESVEYAIATAHLTNQGLATTSGVLGYAGKPFKTLIGGINKNIYGWQDLRCKHFWQLNKRLLGNCDIPDLTIFQKRYPQLKTIRFQAALELKFLHILLYSASWLVRFHLLPKLNKLSHFLLKLSHLFDNFGTNDAGFYMELKGKSEKGTAQTLRFDLIARAGDGLYIPCTPAILLARDIIKSRPPFVGATPCVGLIDLDLYLKTLKDLNLNIEWQVTRKI